MKQCWMFILILLANTATLRAQIFAWHPLSSFHASFPYSIAVSPSGTLYTASNQEYDYVQGAFLGSGDAGKSWRFISGIPAQYAIQSILAPNDMTLLACFYANTEYHGPSVSTIPGTYLSTDAGKTWTLCLKKEGTLVGISNNIVILQADSVYCSPDLGQSWIPVTLPTPFAYLRIFPTTTGFFARCDSTLYFTTDLTNWKTVRVFSRKESGPCFPTPNGYIAAFHDSTFELSTDLGNSWQVRRTNLILQGDLIKPVCFLRDGCLIGTTNYGPFRSNDSGITWTAIEAIGAWTDGGQFWAADSSNNAYFGGSGYEIDRVSNTSTQTTECGPWNMPVRTLAAMSNGSVIAGNPFDPNWGDNAVVSKDNGGSWNPLLPLQAQPLWFGYSRSAGLVAEAHYYGIDRFLHSPDALAWGEIAPIPYGGSLAGFDRVGTTYFTDGSVTTDRGTTWLHRSAPPAPQVIGLPDGSAMSGTYRSTNQGLSWQATTTNPPSGAFISMACDSNSDILLVTQAGTFLSENLGATWSPLSDGLPTDSAIRQVCYSIRGFWIAATRQGVYCQFMGNGPWSSLNYGLDDLDVYCVDVDLRGNCYAGTSMAGVYATRVSRPTSVPTYAPQKFSYSAYPNPSANTVTVSFQLPRDEEVMLTLYDVLGNKVRTLLSRWMASGNQTFSFDHSEIDPGEYFLRITSDISTTLPLQFIR